MKLTYEKKIGENTTETRLGRGRFSLPTGKMTYTKPSEPKAAKSNALRKAMNPYPKATTTPSQPERTRRGLEGARNSGYKGSNFIK